MPTTPWVYIVGAGPGDPELLTVKAHRLLKEADAVVYDRLVGPGILALIPAGAARIYVGKAQGAHHMTQDEINDLLVSLARPGRKVVRLKGGDPFVFGRGSEEADHLARHGIPFAVVPGITAASGCAASAGFPLTHRGVAAGVRFVTGHGHAGAAPDLDWATLADPDTTLVVYMGLAKVEEIGRRLVAAGLPATTPAAAIASGTTAEQRVCRATLGDLAQRVAAAGLAPPVLVVIGRVVGFIDRWGLEACESDVRSEAAPAARLGRG